METVSKRYKIRFTERLLGGTPMNKATFTKYIVGDQEIPDDEESTVRDEEQILTGFHQDDEGIFLMDYMIKGFLKEAGNIIKDIVKIKALRSKIDNYVFIAPRRIYIASAAAGILERPLRAMTMQGPRVTIARSEYIEPTTVEFEIKLLQNKEITFEIIDKLLEYGKLKGLGQWRNGGYGVFQVI